MLTPEIDDKNRKAELKRKEQDPRAFGVPHFDVKAVAERNLEGHNHVTEQRDQAPADQETEEERIAREEAEQKTKDEQAAAEQERIRKEWEDYLDQPVGVLIGELPNVQDKAQLVAMQSVEAETKNRKTLIEAIAAEIAKRGE